MATADYTAQSIEVLSGLDPVRKRPGMYTDTSRPNHIAQEAIDNSADEGIGGFASEIRVTLFEDGSLEVIDNGRGMPVDIHPEHKVSGVELIMTRLHAGGKFSKKNYQFSGGLHGVGISVLNALCLKVIVTIDRDGHRHQITFKNGDMSDPLKKLESVPKRQTGTGIRFWPDPQYFDSVKFSVSRLMQVLKAKAVLCSGLKIIFDNKIANELHTWHYESGLKDYLLERLADVACIPEEPFEGDFSGKTEAVSWVLTWQADTETIAESYVNLVPTIQGGTHVNGLRSGLLDALREFCDIRNLLPRGVKLVSEDVWQGCNYVLSVKLAEPQFSGQTKERLTSRECATFIGGVVKDAFSLWLNQHVELGEQIAMLAIDRAQSRLKSAKAVTRKKIVSGPALPGKLTDCVTQDPRMSELFLVEGDSAGGSAKQARQREFQAVMPLRGKILNTWEVDSAEIMASQEIHDISVAIGVDPGSTDLSSLRYGKICILADADSDGAHIATLLCALFQKHFRPLVEAGHLFAAMPPLYRIDIGKEVFYALDDAEKQGILDRIIAEKKTGKVNVQRFKGLGEMNPLQLRETTMMPQTRRLVQLTIDEAHEDEKLDLLLAKKRASDRKTWLESKGDLAEV